MKALLCFFSIPVFFLCASVHADELRIASPHWEGYKREFEWAFSEWYQERHQRQVSIRWLDLGGASDMLRYIVSQSNTDPGGDIGVDVVFGGGIDPFVELKRLGLLGQIKVPEETLSQIPPEIGGNPLYDKEHQWFSVNLAGFGIIFNKVLLKKYDLPEIHFWKDIADPRFAGWIGSADPRKSGSVRFMYELILQYYGWDEGWKIIYGIGANVRVFSSHSSQTPKDIALGEIAAGVLIDSYAREAIREAGEDKVGFIVPEEFPAVYGDAVAVMKHSPAINVANEFAVFCISERAQGLLMRRVGSTGGPRRYELGRMSILPKIYELPSSERIMLQAPFRHGATFVYDPHRAAERWSVVTALLGGIAVDLKEDLMAAADHTPGFFSGMRPPLTEEAVLRISHSGEWKDPVKRARILSEAQNNLLTSLPAKSSESATRFVPLASAVLLLALIILRKRLR